MNALDVIKNSIEMGQTVCMAYLGDLSSEDLMRRPHPDANHITWQLGHLIAAEHSLVDGCVPGSMPALPEGFADKYSKETTKIDDASAFHSKDELLAVFEQQRAATLAALDKLSEEDLDRVSAAVPKGYEDTFGTYRLCLQYVADHWYMHRGQLADARRAAGIQRMWV